MCGFLSQTRSRSGENAAVLGSNENSFRLPRQGPAFSYGSLKNIMQAGDGLVYRTPAAFISYSSRPRHTAEPESQEWSISFLKSTSPSELPQLQDCSESL